MGLCVILIQKAEKIHVKIFFIDEKCMHYLQDQFSFIIHLSKNNNHIYAKQNNPTIELFTLVAKFRFGMHHQITQ